MKDSTIALLAAAGIGAYLWYKNQQQQQLNAAVPAPVSTPGTSAPLPSTATQVQSAVASGAVVTNDLCTNRVTSWFNTLSPGNKAQAFAQLPNMTEDEITALCGVFDQWAAGNITAPKLAQSWINFWNTWRVKYHILDGTYN